jgi:putative nucleotidyltransferase with HDIG domain
MMTILENGLKAERMQPHQRNPMKIDEKIRQGVIESLPEAKLIQDNALREKVYDAWALSLQETEYTKIEDIPASGVPDSPPLKRGTQADHLRSVARLSMAFVNEFKEMFQSLAVDMDEVIAGALCHDLGKPFEFSRINQERWSSDPCVTGKPSIRHTVYGVHIALTTGLPEKIAHIAGAHSKEGEHIERSLVADIIFRVDHSFWRILAKAGLLQP